MSDRSALQRLVSQAVAAHDQAHGDVNDPDTADAADRGLAARRTVIDPWSVPTESGTDDE